MNAVIASRPNNWTRLPEGLGKRLRPWQGHTHHGACRVAPVELEREWLFQVKREKEVGPEDLRKIVRKAVPDPSKAPYAFVAAVASGISSQARDAFNEEARKAKVRHYEVWDKVSLQTALQNPKLGRLAAFYFGNGSAIEGTTHLPLSLDRSPGRDAPLSGRADLVTQLLATTGDVLLIGAPGTGKTRLAAELDGVRYLAPLATPDDVAESLRDRSPSCVVVDDAGFDLKRLEMMLDLRREGYQFRLIGTVWPAQLHAVRRVIQPATEIEVDPLGRKPMDDFIQAIGVRDHYWREEILDQAEGRPGWGVSIQLGSAGHGDDVLSGRVLIAEIESLVGPSPVRVIRVLAVMSVLGSVDREHDLPERQRSSRSASWRLTEILTLAAGAGVVDETAYGLAVAPNIAYRPRSKSVFRRRTSVGVDRQSSKGMAWSPIAHLVIGCWRCGAWLHASSSNPGQVIDVGHRFGSQRPADICRPDRNAAERAMRETTHLPLTEFHRQKAVNTAAAAFILPAAVDVLLDAAVTDTRAENQYPEHPIRLLGELGSRITPRHDTTFDARMRVLRLAETWLDRTPGDAARQVVWARLAAQLMDPTVHGGYSDPGAPMTFQLSAGTETDPHLRVLVDDLWPLMDARLPHLKPEALVEIANVADDWIRLARRITGNFGHIPPESATQIGQHFTELLLPRLTTVAAGKPAAQLALLKHRAFWGMRRGIGIDPELRILNWEVLQLNNHPTALTAIGNLVDRWAAEDPVVLMTRLAQWANEAAKAKTQLPAMPVALALFGDRVADLGVYVDAGLDSGLTGELYPLMTRSVTRQTAAPVWLAKAFGTPARGVALQAVLDSDSGSGSIAAAISELTPADVGIVDLAVARRPRDDDPVSYALLTHSNDDIRGTAALGFRPGPKGRGPILAAGMAG